MSLSLSRTGVLLGVGGVGALAGWMLGAKWALVGGPVGALFGAAVGVIASSYAVPSSSVKVKIA
jgi:hypothetical protein